ncbi:MATE family efflux transporter [Paraburkholderia sp. NMBU_R16]|uniref:MATE family efflux transporter n=1 Tax=Paraburkholderia sp. NMBU_R16 TaxID=2698676 RepID=UPI0015642E59|nr:MATE family efflux transporter [Paraburkholderia sp. NMBU_R16]NRO98357.1 MATE family efflux transporter [Paraburkholderia sp. NMBU_R16]
MNSEHGRRNDVIVNGPVGRTLLELLLPILLSNVLQSLNGSIDAMWVGRYIGKAALAATANANTILSFVVASIMGFAMAATILIGRSLGASDLHEAKKTLGTSATFFAVVSTSIAAAGLLGAEPLLVAMHSPPSVLPLAAAYLRIMFAAVPFQTSYLFVTIVVRSAGDTRTPLLFQLAAVGLDIVLNPVLICGWGPIPGAGIAGSAAATLIAQTSSLAALAVYLYRRRHVLCLRADDAPLLRPDWSRVRTIVTTGIPMGLQMAVVSLSTIAMISLVNRFGASTTAAYSACLQLWNYVQMPALATGMAVSTMAAQNIGARRPDRVRRIARTGILLNLAITGSLVAAISAASDSVLRIFLPADAGVVLTAQHIQAAVTWSFVPLGVTFVLSSIARACGAVRVPLVILFVAFWCIRLPFAALLMRTWGADALWWSFGLGAIVAMTMSLAWYGMRGSRCGVNGAFRAGAGTSDFAR